MQTFQQVINSDIPVLIDFHAEWCGPCKIMKSVILDLKKKVGGKAKVIKIDVDKNLLRAARFNICSVPTFILFKNGKVQWQHSGIVSLNQLEQLILTYS